MERKRATARHYELLEVLELQLCARHLEVEMLARYVTDPRNLAGIRRILGRAFRGLKGLQRRGYVRPPNTHWLHSHCKTVPVVCSENR